VSVDTEWPGGRGGNQSESLLAGGAGAAAAAENEMTARGVVDPVDHAMLSAVGGGGVHPASL